MGDSGVGVQEWHNTTTLHPLGLLVTLILGTLIIMMPRRYAVAPMIVLACFMPSAQRLIIMGSDFDLLRILILFAWVRLFVRNEFQGFAWNHLDTVVVAWKVSGALVFTLAFGTTSAFINRCGWMFDGFGMYFFFRCVLRDWQDVNFLIRTFIVISLPVAVAFLIERVTGRNVFSIFGGVPEITSIRDGKLRCQGAYSHPILAGCFWASIIPWMIVYIKSGSKWLSVGGIVSALFIILNTASSTPLLAIAFVVLGMVLFHVRAYTRLIRWSLLAVLVLLHFTMQGPVWSLIARINVVGGSTGWHRYSILDATIKNFSEWWLLGEKDPMSWGVWEMRDITNHFILEALRGGLLSLTLFILAIAFGFSIVGKALKTQQGTDRQLVVWSFGASLFVHVCIFFAVSYFGQTSMLIYLNFAMIGSLPQLTAAGSARQAPERVSSFAVPSTPG